MKRRAVMLDRDGTLIKEAGYLDQLDRIELYPYTIDALRMLNRGGFAVIVATNQSGVARGLFDESFVAETHRHLDALLATGGARIDGWYHCPHHPKGIRDEYRQECSCRKPLPGLLQRAAADLDLDLPRSFAVGDRWHDVEAATAAGAKGILVQTGYGRLQAASRVPGVVPAARVENLIEAVSWILRQP
jgi:D-glycero-D-manno-heptose 1,7-bisphosphate phosphatase